MENMELDAVFSACVEALRSQAAREFLQERSLDAMEVDRFGWAEFLTSRKENILGTIK